MSYTVTEESLDGLSVCRADKKQALNWEPLFVDPAWLRVWWDCFGAGRELFLRAVRQDEKIIGIAPLMASGDTASFAGSTDVCDYQDFIASPGAEDDFFTALLDHLRERGIVQLDLGHVRPDSTVLTILAGIAWQRGCEVEQVQEDVSVELGLPPTWDEYLELLTTKQRHEVRRKLRRLSEAGDVKYRFISDGTETEAVMGTFLKMFAGSRQYKADFLTGEMEGFFRKLAGTMAAEGLLRLGVLEVDTKPAAMIMCFDYNNCVYLYNSGFDTNYEYLSVGLMSKVLAVKDSIERGKQRFDFLKGAETYKYRLGGREVPLYRCRIKMNES